MTYSTIFFIKKKVIIDNIHKKLSDKSTFVTQLNSSFCTVNVYIEKNVRSYNFYSMITEKSDDRAKHFDLYRTIKVQCEEKSIYTSDTTRLLHSEHVRSKCIYQKQMNNLTANDSIRLTVKLCISMSNDSRFAYERRKYVQYQNDLLFKQRNKDCDVIIHCADGDAYAHRFILSMNSEVFNNMLNSNFKEAIQVDGKYTIHCDDVSTKTFNALLDLLYGKTPTNYIEDDVYNLAEYYLMKHVMLLKKR